MRIALLLALLFLIPASSASAPAPRSVAVLQTNTWAYEEPNGGVISSITPGSLGRVLERRRGWVRIELENRSVWRSVWVPRRATRVIRQPEGTGANYDVAPRRNCRSRSIGSYQYGRLRCGVRMPAFGINHFTWDIFSRSRPAISSRVWGHSRLIGTIYDVLNGYRRARPNAVAVGIGDLSLRYGGEINRHVSHESGLDVDIYFPRRDRRARAPGEYGRGVDHNLARDLIARFARRREVSHVFVAPRYVGRPNGKVQYEPGHQDHLHVRLRR